MGGGGECSLSLLSLFLACFLASQGPSHHAIKSSLLPFDFASLYVFVFVCVHILSSLSFSLQIFDCGIPLLFFFLSGNISNNESVYYSCTAYPSSHLTSWGKVDCTHMLSRIRYARLLRSSNPSWQVVISAVHWPSYRSAGRRPQPCMSYSRYPLLVVTYPARTVLFPCWQWRHPYKI